MARASLDTAPNRGISASGSTPLPTTRYARGGKEVSSVRWGSAVLRAALEAPRATKF